MKINVNEIQENKYGDEYEVWDIEKNAWVSPKNSCYHTKKSTGFPNPEEALEPIVLVQLFDTKTNKGYVLGLEEWFQRDDYTYDFNLDYIKFDTEKDLIKGFINLFKTLDPFLIYAWNGEGFDFPYIFNRLKNLGISTNNFSNYGSATLKTKKLNNGQIQNDIISAGHQWIDLLAVYKKFVYKNVPSYSLETIAELEAGIKKVSHDNYIKFDDFRTGKYVITGKETNEQKASKIHKCAMFIESNPDHAKVPAMKEYIKQKSYSEFVHYGAIDFVALKGIHDAQNFTQLMMTMASEMGCTIADTLGTLKAWDCYITSFIMKDKLIAPPHSEGQEGDGVVGGYVQDPVVGKHRWILSSDVNSMYPLLGMASFNMSPETFIAFDDRPAELQAINKLLGTQDEEKILSLSDEQWKHIKDIGEKYNVAFGIGGAVYKKDVQGVIPKLVTDIYIGRKQAKKEMFKLEQQGINIKAEGGDDSEFMYQAGMKNTMQMSAKLQINGLYGALAAKHFSMYNEQMAQSITGNGRYFIRLLAENIENKLQTMIPSNKTYIIAGDTDSVYFQIETFVNKYTEGKDITEKVKWSDAFYKKVIEKIVQDTINQFSNNLCAFDSSWIGAEREIIADTAIFVAKKKYCARVLDLEGKHYPVNDPYIKVQGLEIIQGGTSPFAKKNLKEAIPILMDKDEDGIRDWFSNVRGDFLNWPLDDISKTQGVSKVENPEWGQIINGRKVSIPFGSRVCVVSNTYISQNNLQEQFPLIAGGDKVKILFLRKPNVLNSEAFAFSDVRFAEMFRREIDYDETFQRFFVKPLQGMLDAIGIDLNNNTEVLDEW